MDTATQINNLLLHLDRAALALTTPQHPDLELHLDINCTLPGACGIVDCELIEAHVTRQGVDATLAPAHSHCVECDAIYLISPGAHDVYCPSCAARPGVPDTNPL